MNSKYILYIIPTWYNFFLIDKYTSSVLWAVCILQFIFIFFKNIKIIEFGLSSTFKVLGLFIIYLFNFSIYLPHILSVPITYLYLCAMCVCNFTGRVTLLPSHIGWSSFTIRRRPCSVILVCPILSLYSIHYCFSFPFNSGFSYSCIMILISNLTLV